jgi:two-component system NtrC family sensor kinase
MVDPGWLSILVMAKALPTGQWTTALGLLFAGFVIYAGFRYRYVAIWLGGWMCLLLSREAISASAGSVHGQALMVGGLASFVIAITLFSLSAVDHIGSWQDAKWIVPLSAAALAAGAVHVAWLPESAFLYICFEVAYHAILLMAVLRLVLFAIGRHEMSPWFMALALLLLRPIPPRGSGPLVSSYGLISELLLLFSILLLVIDESRARERRMAVMGAITSAAIGAREYSGMMLTALRELCTLYGAGFAWSQLVSGNELMLELHVGLPDGLAARRARVPISDSAASLLQGSVESIVVSVRDCPPDLRQELQHIGIHYLLMAPVMGKEAMVGVLSLGLSGRRSFTAEQRKFLSATANQLGIARENLRIFERVAHSQRQWLSTIDAIDDCILVHDSEPRILRLNKALARRLGRPLRKLTGLPLASVLPNAESGCPYCRLAKLTDGEVADPCFGGYSSISTSTYIEEQDDSLGWVHIISDRSERRAAEERYRMLFDSVHEGVFVSTPQGQLLDCNPAFASMLGYPSRSEMLGINIAKDLFPDAQQRAAYVEAMEKQGDLRSYEVTLRRKDGSVVTLLENSFASRDAQGKIVRYQGFLLDITEKKHAEDEMRRHNRELSALNAMATIAARTFNLNEILQNTLHWAMVLFAQHCDILLFDVESGKVVCTETSRDGHSESHEGLHGPAGHELSDFITREGSELLTEQDLPRLPESVRSWFLAQGCASFISVAIYSQRKTLGILLISSPQKDRFTLTDRDLAINIARQLGNSVEKVLLYEETAHAYENLRNAQEQLLQSEKMSAIGQLISGVAHELNNPLTAILGYTQLLETEPIGERAQDFVQKLYRQAQRTHRVVQNLLSFSRQRKPIQSQVDVRRVLEDTLALREFDLKLNEVTVVRDFDPTTPFVTADAHQLEQVFLNIINNAVDAIMDSAPSGTLKVRMWVDDKFVCVEFHDSGPGLKDANKIFDPFYTTKKIGKGTGLGLSICYGIVKEHGGDIVAFNHEDGGAVFQLKLPIGGNPRPSDSVPAQQGRPV